MRKKMIIMLGVALLVTGVFGVSVTAQSLRVGVVELSIVLDEALAGRAANERLDGLLAAYQDDLDALGTEIVALEQQLMSDVPLAEDARVSAENKYDELLDAYMGRRQQYEASIQQAAQSLQSQLLQEVAYVLQVFGEINGYDLILDAGTVFYFSSPLDVTQEVIQLYDELYLQAVAEVEQEDIASTVDEANGNTGTDG